MYIKGDSLRDTRMRWDKCYIRIAGTVFWIEEIMDITSSNITFQGSTREKGSWKPCRVTVELTSIDTSHPSKGYINVEKHTYLFMEVAVTNFYKLGLCARRASLKVPNPELIEVGVYPKDKEDIIHKLYNKKYDSFSLSVSKVLNKEVYSVAISPTVALGVSNKLKNVAVYRNNLVIGEVINNEVVLPYYHKYFVEELEELNIKCVCAKEEKFNGKKVIKNNRGKSRNRPGIRLQGLGSIR